MRPIIVAALTFVLLAKGAFASPLQVRDPQVPAPPHPEAPHPPQPPVPNHPQPQVPDHPQPQVPDHPGPQAPKPPQPQVRALVPGVPLPPLSLPLPPLPLPSGVPLGSAPNLPAALASVVGGTVDGSLEALGSVSQGLNAVVGAIPMVGPPTEELLIGVDNLVGGLLGGAKRSAGDTPDNLRRDETSTTTTTTSTVSATSVTSSTSQALVQTPGIGNLTQASNLQARQEATSTSLSSATSSTATTASASATATTSSVGVPTLPTGSPAIPVKREIFLYKDIQSVA